MRAGYRVPLPHDVATALDEKQNPIRALIRNGFRRNSSEISLRLVNSALNKGYRFLELLTLARDESSPAHADVLRFLRENNERVLAIREKKRQEEEKLKKRWAPNPDTVPLLTKIPNPSGGGPPTFVPTVRPLPLEKLSGGVRKLPTLDELGGHPFLRLRKPQSEYLGRVLSQKFQRRQRWADKYQELVSEELADAEQEDAWDDMVEDMLRGEPQPWEDPRYYATDGVSRQQWTQNKQSAKRARTDRGSYAHAIKLAMADIELKQKRTMEEMVARGRALWKLVLEERALAEKEKKSRKRREKIQRKRERRRAAKEERKKARMSRIMRKWRLKTQERKKKEKAGREKLRMEQDARKLEEAISQEPVAAQPAVVEQHPRKMENEDSLLAEGRLRGSQALKATRRVKKTNAPKLVDAKDTESPAVPAESAKEPEPRPEEPIPTPPAPKKRGRPKKVDSETPATQPSTEPETSAPRKRGRPRKVVAAPEDNDAASTGTLHQITGASHDGGGGVSRDAFPPMALHPTGRNQIWNRPMEVRPKHVAKGSPEWQHEKRKRERFKKLKETTGQRYRLATKPLITTKLGRPKKDSLSSPAAAALFAKARIQSLLICELYRYHSGYRSFAARPRNPDDPLNPLATSVITTRFDERIVKLPPPLTNKTTASAALALGLNLDKTNVLWNGGLYIDKAAASEHDKEYLGQIHFGLHWDTMLLRAARQQRRGRYTMDLWAEALQRWVEIDGESNFRASATEEISSVGEKTITLTRWWWPDPTPESQEIMVKALAQAVLDELVRCSTFKYKMVMEQQHGDDGSDRLSSLVGIPDRVKSLLGMSTSSTTMATETETDDNKELVLWGGEVMEFGEAKRKDYDMWRVQSDAKKKRWLSGGTPSDYLLESYKDKRPIIRRVFSGGKKSDDGDEDISK